MPDLSTTYMGLHLSSPLIAGASGLTGTVKGLQNLQAGGFAAVVLKSIFEEEIAVEYEQVTREVKRKGMSLESYDYYDYQVRGDRVAAYVQLVAEAKKALTIPVVASINCTWSHEWVSFAREIETAGAELGPQLDDPGADPLRRSPRVAAWPAGAWLDGVEAALAVPPQQAMQVLPADPKLRCRGGDGRLR